MASLDAWFTSPNNKVSSAHFGVSKHGDIHQYVKLERMAWTQGISADRIAKAPAAIVREKGINPNLYGVSIEHEGYDGNLSEEQFEASLWLHRYIRDYVKQEWGYVIPFNREHILGHFQIDPVRKSSCPGPKFPWIRLYAMLAKPSWEEQQMEQLRLELQATKAVVADLEARLAVMERDHHLSEVPDWAKASVNKAVQQGLIRTPTPSSHDFFRILTVLDRKGLL
ncbi:N-acetylmuramoyl-L-alanine amidase [Paenibacillus sp. 481]|nr:N-acetylmuramoyl-L-alanine amidase [Paenibacillus sp. 481]